MEEFAQFHDEFVGNERRNGSRQTGHEIRRADLFAHLGGVERTQGDTLSFAGAGETFEAFAARGFLGNADELRVFDPIRADSRDFDFARLEFFAESLTVPQEESFRRSVDIETGDRLKGGAGGDLHDMRIFLHIRKRNLRCEDRGAAVEINHGGGVMKCEFFRQADFAESGIGDEPLDIGTRRVLQFASQHAKTLDFREVEGENTRPFRKRGGKFIETFFAASDEPDFVDKRFRVNDFCVFAAESARSTRDNGKFHKKFPSRRIDIRSEDLLYSYYNIYKDNTKGSNLSSCRQHTCRKRLVAALPVAIGETFA